MVRFVIISLCILLSGCASTAARQQNFPAEISNPVDLEDEENGRLEKLAAPELLREGRDYLQKGNLQLAQVHFFAALKKEPESVELYSLLAETFFRSGDLKKAYTIYRIALEKNPEHVPALLALGVLERGVENLSAAANYLETATKLAPTHVEVLSELAITYDQMHRYQEAETLHLKVIEIWPNFSAGHNNLGFHYLLRDLYPEAIECFQKALHFLPANPSARNNLAMALVMSGEESKGLVVFQDSVGMAQAWNNLGFILMRQGKYEKAEKAFRRALDLNPKFYGLAKKNLDTMKANQGSIFQ